MRIVRIFIRILGGALGVAAGLAALFIPLLFVSNELQELRSMKQYNGHVSILGAIGGTLTVLLFAGLAGFLSFFFLRYAIRGNG